MNPVRSLLEAKPLGLALLGLLIFPGVGTGQSGPGAEAQRFVAAWDVGDIPALERAMRSDGIRLHIHGETHISIKPKQAVAALKAFLDRYPDGESEVKKASETVGDPDLGFAEITYRTNTSGVPGPVIFSLFIGYALERDTWRVTEIRVFR